MACIAGYNHLRFDSRMSDELHLAPHPRLELVSADRAATQAICHLVSCHVTGRSLRLDLLIRIGELAKANLDLPQVPPPRNGPIIAIKHMKASQELQAPLSKLSVRLIPDIGTARTTQSGWLMRQVQA